MTRRAICPPGSEAACEAMSLSPGVVSGNHVFLTGMTGSLPDGGMPGTPEAQFHKAFEKIEAVLIEAGSSCRNLVEMTSYHIEIQMYFELFNQVRAQYVAKPFPAWTAVEVSGLRRPGALVEVRVVAALDPQV